MKRIWLVVYVALAFIHDIVGCDYGYPWLCNAVEYSWRQGGEPNR